MLHGTALEALTVEQLSQMQPFPVVFARVSAGMMECVLAYSILHGMPYFEVPELTMLNDIWARHQAENRSRVTKERRRGCNDRCEFIVKHHM